MGRIKFWEMGNLIQIQWLFIWYYVSGLILLPMTFLSGTPVECTIHPALWPGPRNYTPTVNEASDNDLDWSLYHSDNPEQMVSNFHIQPNTT